MALALTLFIVIEVGFGVIRRDVSYQTHIGLPVVRIRNCVG